MGRVEIGRLGGVDGTSAAHGHEGVEVPGGSKPRRLLKAGIGRFD